MRLIYTCILLICFSAVANKTQTVYRSVQKDGVVMFSDRPPIEGHYQRLKLKCRGCNAPDKALSARALDNIIARNATRHKLDASLIKAVIHAESGFDTHSTSRKGAAGLMQLMPRTSKAFNVIDPYDPAQNIEAGSAYLAALLKRFDGNTQLALAAYNAGPGKVEKYRGVPPYPETHSYLERVARWQRFYHREMNKDNAWLQYKFISSP